MFPLFDFLQRIIFDGRRMDEVIWLYYRIVIDENSYIMICHSMSTFLDDYCVFELHINVGHWEIDKRLRLLLNVIDSTIRFQTNNDHSHQKTFMHKLPVYYGTRLISVDISWLYEVNRNWREPKSIPNPCSI